MKFNRQRFELVELSAVAAGGLVTFIIFLMWLSIQTKHPLGEEVMGLTDFPWILLGVCFTICWFICRLVFFSMYASCERMRAESDGDQELLSTLTEDTPADS